MKSKILQIAHLSMAEVEGLRNWGTISEAVFQAYVRVWEWSAPRFSGAVGQKHEAFFNTYGMAAYYARIDKVRLAFGFQPIGHKP